MPLTNEIKSHFPNAKEGRELTKECVQQLTDHHGFDMHKSLVATSVCSDEVIRSATNFRDYIAHADVFQIGGLAGFPFTGMTGLKAFASHIPDEGGAIIIYGPHIGFREEEGIGYVQRAGQHKATSCCGALIGALAHCQSGSTALPDAELDAQQRHITEKVAGALETHDAGTDPLIHVTNAIYNDIHRHVRTLFERTASSFEHYRVAFVGGVIINTDAGQPDWFDLRHFDVVQ
ncbi:MAG: hypothetical protein ACNA78_08685 [Balneolaceae bacterium]